MSEADIYPTFTTEDIPTNASENDATYGPQTAPMALIDQLDYVDPSFFPGREHDLHYREELNHVAKRRGWLTEADAAFRSQDYTTYRRLLGQVRDDVEHAHYYAQNLPTDIDQLAQLSFHIQSGRRLKGAVAVAEVIKISTNAEVVPHDTLHSIAS